MPVDLQFAKSSEPARDIREADRTSWLSLNLQRLSSIRQIVREQSAGFKYRAAEKRDEKRRDVDWKPGDLVLVYMPTESKGIPKKRLMQWSTLAKIIKRKTYNSYEVQRDDKKRTEIFNVDRLFKMPPGTTRHSLKPDADDELLGVLQVPADVEAHRAAMERKRELRDQARQVAEGKLHDARQPPEEKEPISVEAILKERAEEIKSTMRGPAAVKVNDLVLYKARDTGRWLIGKVLRLIGRGPRRKAMLQVYWKRLNGLNPKINDKMDWAPLWNKVGKSSLQTAVWKKPQGYEPYTTMVMVRKLRLIGIKLQKYSRSPRGRLKHRIDPAWWEVLRTASAIFEWFGPE